MMAPYVTSVKYHRDVEKLSRPVGCTMSYLDATIVPARREPTVPEILSPYVFGRLTISTLDDSTEFPAAR
jgi:hypothetical protein